MQNQQILTKISHLEEELKKIKISIQKTPPIKTAHVWAKINILQDQIDEAKTSIFDFDIEKFVTKHDVASWK